MGISAAVTRHSSLVNSPAAARGSAARPYLTSLSRASAKPGIRLTIRGRGFGAKRGKGKVLFGVFKSTKYVCWSKTRIVCAVPAIPAGRVTLKVRTATRTSNGKRFTVQSLPTVVPKTTDVLTDATVADASTTDGSTYTFTDASETSALAPGDVIVGEPTAALPDGIFGKVTAVAEGGGSVPTEPATLEGVFTRAQFSADHPITQDDVASATLPAGMSLVRSHAQRPELITLRFKEVGVSDDLATDFGPVAPSGTITLKITMHVGGAIDWGGVKSFEIGETTTVSSDLRASSSLSASVGAEKEWEIAKTPGFTVMAGPVPSTSSRSSRSSSGSRAKSARGSRRRFTRRSPAASASPTNRGSSRLGRTSRPNPATSPRTNALSEG